MLVRRTARTLPLVLVLILGLILGAIPGVIATAAPALAPAATKQATRAGLSGPRAATYGTTITLSGYLRDATGQPLRGATVAIQRSPRNRNQWRTFTTQTVGLGNFEVRITQSAAWEYRVHYAGSAKHAAATSQPVYPAVLRKVILDSLRTTSWETGTLRATGRVFPAPAAGSPVYLQRWVPATKAWRTIGRATASSTGAVTITSRAAGSVLTYRLYAPFAAAPGPYGAGVSKALRFQNFVWRGVFHKPVLATGGTGNARFSVIPAADAPYRSEADLVADAGGTVWGELNTSGCAKIEAFFGNISDGAVQVTLQHGGRVLGETTMSAESERDLNLTIVRTPRLRVQVRDLGSAYGPVVATDIRVLCNN